MKTINGILTIMVLLMLSGCVKKDTYVAPEEIDQAEASLTVDVLSLSNQQLTVQNYVKERPIIAHRGTTNYAPQGTAAAYRFARYVGADYLQIDLQMTRDGYLVAFKGENLEGKSDVDELFPGYENAPIYHFTLAELKTLDIGSWFTSSTYDRPGFQGLKILTLEEIINICEGKLEDGSPDPADTGNRPGIYIRMYDPWLNPGIEEKLKAELTRLGWYDDNLDNLRAITTFPDKVGVANTKGRVFLATLQNASLLKLEEVFGGKLPLAYWLWFSSSHMPSDDAETYAEFINYGIEHGAQFIAPNISTYDLLQPWQSNLIRRTNARIQAYTVDTKAKMGQYTYNNLTVAQGNIYQLDYDLTDGFITNRTQYARYFYGHYYLGDPIVPAPPYYNTNAIKNVFITLGY